MLAVAFAANRVADLPAPVVTQPVVTIAVASMVSPPAFTSFFLDTTQ